MLTISVRLCCLSVGSCNLKASTQLKVDGFMAVSTVVCWISQLYDSRSVSRANARKDLCQLRSSRAVNVSMSSLSGHNVFNSDQLTFCWALPDIGFCRIGCGLVPGLWFGDGGVAGPCDCCCCCNTAANSCSAEAIASVVCGLVALSPSSMSVFSPARSDTYRDCA